MKKIRIFIMLGILILICTSAFAIEILNVNIKIYKKTIKVNEEFLVYVEWNENMQAADFKLQYDSEKVELISTDLEDDYFQNDEAGNLRVSWFSLEDKDKNNIEFKFKAKSSGNAKFELDLEDGGFATGELEIPEGYDISNSSIYIKSPNIVYIIASVVAIILVIIIHIIKKKRK